MEEWDLAIYKYSIQRYGELELVPTYDTVRECIDRALHAYDFRVPNVIRRWADWSLRARRMRETFFSFINWYANGCVLQKARRSMNCSSVMFDTTAHHGRELHPGGIPHGVNE